MKSLREQIRFHSSVFTMVPWKKRKKVVPAYLKTDRHAEVKKFIVKTFQA